MEKLQNNIFKLSFMSIMVLVFALFFKMPAQAKDNNKTLHIFAASSLTTLLEHMRPALEKASNSNIKFSFASSAVLARQIANGAPANIFISADVKWLNWLNQQQAKGLNFSTIAHNKIIIAAHNGLISPLGDNAPISEVQTLFQKVGSGYLSMADPDLVPLGHYSRQAISNLKLENFLPENILYTNSAQQTVRFLTAKSAQLGLIYKSDLVQNKGLINVYTFPANSYDKINYQTSIVSSYNETASKAVINYLSSDPAQQVLSHFGFEPVNNNQESTTKE